SSIAPLRPVSRAQLSKSRTICDPSAGSRGRPDRIFRIKHRDLVLDVIFDRLGLQKEQNIARLSLPDAIGRPHDHPSGEDADNLVEGQTPGSAHATVGDDAAAQRLADLGADEPRDHRLAIGIGVSEAAIGLEPPAAAWIKARHREGPPGNRSGRSGKPSAAAPAPPSSAPRDYARKKHGERQKESAGAWRVAHR